MATTIVTKSGSGAPTASDLVAGELAVDLTNKRLYTEDSGGTVLELGTNPSGNITFGDNGKAIFGAGSDLQIYHDGSNSYIKDTTTGNLNITGNDIQILNAAADEAMAYFAQDGGVTFYHNGLAKIATTATGIDVTGSVTSGAHLINAASTAFGASSVQGFNTDFLVDTGQGYARHNSYHTGGSNHQFLVNEASSTTNAVAFSIAKDKTATFSGNVGIGTSSPQRPLHVNGTEGVARFTSTASGNNGFEVGIGTSSQAFLWQAENSYIQVATNNTERMRIDSSGNLLVSKSASDGGVAGHELRAGSFAIHTRDNGPALYARRIGSGTNDTGDVQVFENADGKVASMGFDGVNLYVNFSETNNVGIASGTSGGDPVLFPTGNTGAVRDAAVSLGYGNGRFKDIYRSGSTFQTSDRTMKQDIRDLTDAERNVAVVCKGLLKAFRFIDAVEKEGVDANIHFGIIAQDLAAAFAAEGLDANDYQAYKSIVTTDEDGNEQTSLNVCYENLLAFIIAAI